MDQPLTVILHEAQKGSETARDQVFRLTYRQLHASARRLLGQGNRHHTLTPTVLINEAYINLFGDTQVDINDRTHFFAQAALAMRHAMLDYIREKRALKRGGDRERIVSVRGSASVFFRDQAVG